MAFDSARDTRKRYLDLQREAYQRYRLTLEEYLCLEVLLNLGEMSQYRLGRETGVTRGGISRMIPRLRTQGLIVTRNIGKRQIVSLTSVGRTRFAA